MSKRSCDATTKKTLQALAESEEHVINGAVSVLRELLTRDYGALRTVAMQDPNLCAHIDFTFKFSLGKKPEVEGKSEVSFTRTSQVKCDLQNKNEYRTSDIE